MHFDQNKETFYIQCRTSDLKNEMKCNLKKGSYPLHCYNYYGKQSKGFIETFWFKKGNIFLQMIEMDFLWFQLRQNAKLKKDSYPPVDMLNIILLNIYGINSIKYS